jgi:two-component system phosphate regulon sensor histidine kinase PhoR
MFWPLLTILLIGGLVALHFRWRWKFHQAQEARARELENLRRSQQQSSLQTQTQQEALFNSMAEGLLLLDPAGKIQLANPAFARLFGVGMDIRSRTIMETLRLHELAELVGALGPHNQTLGRELKLLRPNERWLEVNASAIFNPDGKRQGTILVFHDLTRLRQLERTRQEFVANVSHELRTPLSLIKGYIETLLDGAINNSDVASKFLETIDRNAERLKLLIEDLLTISELESGRVKLSPHPVALKTAVEKVVGDFRARADAKQMSLTDQVPDLYLQADADRLEQVLFNLVDNAIKYGRNRGSVVVSACPFEDGQIQISVRDDGPGIPAESLERVFERFYRVDKARSREQGGTGLGLSIVKHIVQSHGGKAWAKSQVGQGTTFYVTFPQAVHVPQEFPVRDSPKPLEVQLGGDKN